MEYKICRTCKETFPNNEHFFKWESRKNNTLKHHCKDCFYKKAKVYRETFKQRKLNGDTKDFFKMTETSLEQKEALLFKALKVIYANAFGQLLTKEEYDKLKVVK